MTSIDVTPEPDEIVQAEDVPLQTIPVAVVGPVQSRELPAVRAGYSTIPDVGAGFAVRLLTFEPRRKTAVLTAPAAFWISGTQAGATTTTSSVYVPANSPFVIAHLGEVWACADTDTTEISVMTTWWSE